MNAWHRLWSALTALIVLAAVLMTVNAVTSASAASPQQIYRACANKSTGTLRLVVKSKRCLRSETAMQWAALGTRGPAGATGPSGSKGATGPKGPTGPPAASQVVNIGIAQQPAPPAAVVDCLTTFDTLCKAGPYFWNQGGRAGHSWLGYFVEPTGFIQFQGAAQNVGQSDLGVVFVLPPGRRPFADLRFPVGRWDNLNSLELGYVDVRADGRVQIGRGIINDGEVFDFSAVRFLAAR